MFFNLPVRRKFLRSEETERAHIQHYLTLAALAHPEVAFTFTHDGRAVWQLPGLKPGKEPAARLDALRERLRAIYGGDQKLLAVEFSTPWQIPTLEEEPDARPSTFLVWGFVGAPGVSRSTRDEQHLFVNRRPVENRGLNFALLEGYHTALMKGRYPVGCLFLEINPAEVDVNIHPAKREVKFHQEKAVRQCVAQAVRETLLQFHAGPAPTPEVQSSKFKVQSLGTKPGVAGEKPIDVRPAAEFIAPSLPSFPQPTTPIPEWPARPSEQKPLPMGFASTRPVETPAPIPTTASPLLSVPLRMVGVVGRLYVVLESDRGLVLMDQHAAHERILFEQMLQRMEEPGTAPSQRLLLPETVELPPRDAQFLREQLATLTRLGVGLSEFGERTFLLDALPPFVKAPNARRFVLELVDELKAAGESVNAMRLGEHMVAKTVCRHAVKANDPLAGPELENLVNDLRRCAMPYTCPHGRPTLIEMNFRELDRKFGRTQ